MRQRCNTRFLLSRLRPKGRFLLKFTKDILFSIIYSILLSTRKSNRCLQHPHECYCFSKKRFFPVCHQFIIRHSLSFKSRPLHFLSLAFVYISMTEELFLANDNNIRRINNSYLFRTFVESKKKCLEQYVIIGSMSNLE